MSKILVTSTQYPYYGGAATNSYALIKYLRNHGHNVVGIFFERKNVPIDPDGIGGVWRFDISRGNKSALSRIIKKRLGSFPEIILAKNYAAPVMSKRIFPRSKTIYLVTGSPQMTDLSSNNISSIRHLAEGKSVVFEREKKCIDIVDLVVPNSPQARQMLVRNYGNLPNLYKPIDTSLAFNQDIFGGKKFERRRYDVAFVCSNFSRTVKNAELARKILSNRNYANLSKVVIGNNSDIFRGIKNIKIYNLMPQNKVIRILQDSRVVMCTSFYDASPNIIKEAIMSGSNVLVSKNCGWSCQYPKQFVCEDIYNVNEWIIKLAYLKENKIEHSIEFDDAKLIGQINGLL